jgi:hypothetical protein
MGLGLLKELSPTFSFLCLCFPVAHTQVPQILLCTIHPSHSVYLSPFSFSVLQALFLLWFLNFPRYI